MILSLPFFFCSHFTMGKHVAPSSPSNRRPQSHGLPECCLNILFERRTTWLVLASLQPIRGERDDQCDTCMVFFLGKMENSENTYYLTDLHMGSLRNLHSVEQNRTVCTQVHSQPGVPGQTQGTCSVPEEAICKGRLSFWS